MVLACSYEAKARGVRGAMGGARARGLCPDAIVVEPRMSAYTKASKDVFEVFRSTTPLVEGVSIDEAFLDVGGLRPGVRRPAGDRGPARARRCWTRSACGSPSGWPGRSSWPRWPARWPSRTACWWCRRATELEFLHPLPVQRLWGVGPKSTAKLHDLGIYTVGQVAGYGRGRAGLDPGAGVRPAPARAGSQPGSALGARSATGGGRSVRSTPWVGPGTGRRTSTRWSVGLVDRVTRRMRDADRTGRTVMLRLRFDDFSRVTRSRTLLRATAQTDASWPPSAGWSRPRCR